MALLSEYAFDEGTGTTAAPAGSGATITGVPGWATGHTGSALATTAEAGPSVDPFPASTAFSIACWVYVEAASGWTSIFEQGSTATTAIGWVELDVLTLDWFHDSGQAIQGPTLTLDTWHHLVVSADGTSRHLWVDGTLIGSTTSGVAAPSDGFTVGGSSGQPGSLRIDDLRFYDHALSQAEVTSAMNTPVGGSVSSGSATGAWSAAGTAAGTAPGTSSATGTWSAAGTAAGSRASSGTAAGTHSWAGLVLGPARFITAVSASGRYFVDQAGEPILLKGDSPWAIITRSSTASMTNYLETRAAQGFNAVLLSFLGNSANGAPNSNGETFDGIAPFVGGDPASLNSAYWARVEHFLTEAERLSITVMAYPIDGWVGTDFYGGLAADWTTTEAEAYGSAVGTLLAAYPNVIWAVGGDYPVNNGGADDLRMKAVLDGLASAGMDRITTVQFLSDSTSLDSTFWDDLVDFNFVYSYMITYDLVEQAYGDTNPSSQSLPALMSETHYEAFINRDDLYLRSQAAWALTSGSPGEFYGSEDVWDADPQQADLETTAVDQLSAIRATLESLTGWHLLVPDFDSSFITAGRGTKDTSGSEYDEGNTYVTGGVTPDGTLAVIYHPAATSRQITINEAELVAGYTARWVDPTDGSSVAATAGSTYLKTGSNAAGGSDWLLVLEGAAPASGSASGSWAAAGTAGGTSLPAGTAAGSWSVIGDSAGSIDVGGDTTGSWAVTGDSAGSAATSGDAAGSWSVAGDSAGSAATSGDAAGSWSVAGTAVGSAPVVGESSGDAAGSWSVIGGSAGSAVTSGDAAGSWSVIGGSAGSAVTSGDAAGSWSVTGTATSSGVVHGTASGSWQATGAVQGARESSGGATTPWTASGAASGARGAAGGASGAWQATGAATGDAPTVDRNEGQATGAWSAVGTAAGSSNPLGEALELVTWAGSAAGTRTSSGSAAGGSVWQVDGSGAMPLSGAATGTWSVAGAAAGLKPLEESPAPNPTLVIHGNHSRLAVASNPSKVVIS